MFYDASILWIWLALALLLGVASRLADRGERSRRSHGLPAGSDMR